MSKKWKRLALAPLLSESCQWTVQRDTAGFRVIDSRFGARLDTQTPVRLTLRPRLRFGSSPRNISPVKDGLMNREPARVSDQHRVSLTEISSAKSRSHHFFNTLIDGCRIRQYKLLPHSAALSDQSAVLCPVSNGGFGDTMSPRFWISVAGINTWRLVWWIRACLQTVVDRLGNGKPSLYYATIDWTALTSFVHSLNSSW